MLLAGSLACGPDRQAPPLGDDGAPDTAAHGGRLVASIRSEPQTFNRLVARDTASALVSQLTQASLVRLNRTTDTVEPWLAESWARADDDLTYTLRLREGVSFSDGVPFTSGDVVFTFEAVYDESLASPVGDALRIQDRPLDVTAPDASTVVIRFPSPYSPGLRLLDSLPILPKHRLEAARAARSLQTAWGVNAAPNEMAGLGPFVLEDYRPGERLVFARNPAYWRSGEDGAPLPYLDGITLEIVPDQNAEILRLESGQIDLTQSEIRPEDFPIVKRAADAGRARLFDLGAGLDADFLFFNLKPDAFSGDPRRSWLQSEVFRRAIAYAIDRRAFADTVYLGLAEPVYGPVTPGNRRWFSDAVPRYDYDLAQARTLLAELSLRDRNGDGRLEGAAGEPVRFTLLTQRGNTARERAAAVLQEGLRHVGLTVDVVALDFGSLIERVTRMDFDAAYLGFRATDTDPATNLDFWLSSAAFHVWNPAQQQPATDWERRIDELMHQQVSILDDNERKRLFDEVQRVFGEHLPVIHFAAPRIVIATSPRVVNVEPSLLQPQALWNADRLAIASPSGTQPGRP